jgi:hypothetical protein
MLITTVGGLARWCGVAPRWNLLMMIIRPPQQGQRFALRPRLQARARGQRVEATQLALSFRAFAGLDQKQEPGGSGGEAGSRGGLGTVVAPKGSGATRGRACRSWPRIVRWLHPSHRPPASVERAFGFLFQFEPNVDCQFSAAHAVILIRPRVTRLPPREPLETR